MAHLVSRRTVGRVEGRWSESVNGSDRMSPRDNTSVAQRQPRGPLRLQAGAMTALDDIPVTDVSTSTVRAACAHDCPDTCAMLVTVEDGRAVEVRGDPAHPFTQGGLCVKVNDYQDKVYSPDRLLYPMRRTGPKGSGEFQRI